MLFLVFKITLFLGPFFWVQTSYVLVEKYFLFLFLIIHSYVEAKLFYNY